MDGNLREGVSPDAGVSGPILKCERQNPAWQIPLPFGHLSAMFGVSVILAAAFVICNLPRVFHSEEIQIQAARLAEYRVDLNSDRWVEFANLPTIGKRTAQSIVDYGQAIGGYRSIDQLLEVKGVGQKTLAAIRPYIISTHPIMALEQSKLPKR